MVKVSTVKDNVVTFTDGSTLESVGLMDFSPLSNNTDELDVTAISVRGYSIFFNNIELFSEGEEDEYVDIFVKDKDGNILLGTQVACPGYR